MRFDATTDPDQHFEGDGPGGEIDVLEVNHSVDDYRLLYSNPMNGEIAGFWPDGPSFDNIERIELTDGFLAADIFGNAGKAYRVYKAAFNRDPMQGDLEGLGFWVDRIDSGMDMVEVAARFIDSEEFRAIYGNQPTDAEFLTRLYQNVLEREPEAEGYNWWLNEIRTNPEKTRAKVLADFSESAENVANVIELIGNGIEYQPWSMS